MTMAQQMGWTLEQFWQSTPAELYHCRRGWLMQQGIDPDKPPPSVEHGEEVSKRIDEQLLARLKRGA